MEEGSSKQARPAKADPYIESLFKKIQDEKITVDPTVWTLLTHVLGNRAYALTLNLADFLDTPRWILNVGSGIMAFLYKMTGHKGKLYPIHERLQRALSNAYMIKDFLVRLRDATEKKTGF